MESGSEPDDSDADLSLESQIKELNAKVSKLVDTISQLNCTITSLQSEKNELLKKIQMIENKNGEPIPKLNGSLISRKTCNSKKKIDDNSTLTAVDINEYETTPMDRDDSIGETNKDDSTRSHSNSFSDAESDECNVYANVNDVGTHTNKRSNKIPPIDIWNENRAEIQRLIQTKFPQNSCIFGRINNRKFRVFPCDSETRRNVIDFLTKRKYDFNTYTPSDEKMINVIIKGLDHIDDPEMVKHNLAAKGFVPYKVQKHTTGYMRKNNVKSNLWHIVLQPNTDTNALFKVRVIENAVVKFEFLKKPKVIQCKRCQRLFHSASNCNMPYRCVKCASTHEPGKCSSGAEANKFQPVCVNCKGKHTANDAQNCPYLQKAMQKKDERSERINNRTGNNAKQASFSSSKFKNKMSYADSVKMQITTKPNNNNSNPNNKADNFQTFLNQQQKMMCDFMATIQQMQMNFISSYNKNG